MAITRKKTERTVVFITQAEMSTMLGNRAVAAGILTQQPDNVDLLAGNDNDPETGEPLQGWVVEFERNL